VVCREVDRVRVKGKATPVVIYEPVGLATDLGEERHQALATWTRFLDAYRARDFVGAETLLQQLAATQNEKLYFVYQERIAHFAAEPPPADWDGVFTFTVK
jgi:adenylate cyclase